MSTYRSMAEKAHDYGVNFTNRAQAIAGTIGMPVDWLLAIIAWETGNFAASGPPWNARNKKDNGGGIIGFTGADGGSWERMTPTQQLDLLIPYFAKWKTEYNISTFRSPIEAYWIVTAPLGLLMGPEANVGGGRTRQSIVDIMQRVFREGGIFWSYPKVGIEGQWNVRIGNWLGQFVFSSAGDVWYSRIPEQTPGAPAMAEREIAYSDRTYGHWVCTSESVRWRFGPQTDIRRFELSLPAPQRKWEGFIRPVGQGTFKMWKGPLALEPE
jgi:hypothetical protein